MFILKYIDINILGDFVMWTSLRPPLFLLKMSKTAIEFHRWWWVKNGCKSSGLAVLEESWLQRDEE